MATTPNVLDSLISAPFPGPEAGEEVRSEAPEAPASASGARTYGENNVELPEALQNALLALLREAQKQDLYQRRLEVLRARRNRFYERGIQHVYEDSQRGIFVQATPGALIRTEQGDIQCGEFLGDYNVFGRALQIVIAKLTENPPAVSFQPDAGDKPGDLQASEAAEGYRKLYDTRNDWRDLLTAIVRTMGLDGRTITWTRTVADAQKWGYDETSAPVKMQLTTVYGVLESKVPIMAKSQADWPYCILSDDPHLYQAKTDYPDFADEISEQGDEGIGDTQFERLCRIGALQGNSAAYQATDAYAFYVERKHAFFRPSMFASKELDGEYSEAEPRVDENGVPVAMTLRDALLEAFPEGCHVTFVGEQYVASRSVSLDDEITVDFPYAGDGMSRPAIMDPAVVIQDDFNDDCNAYHEVKVTGWPSTWVNEDQTELAAINDQVAAPYCFRALRTRPPRENKMGDQFYREPDPNIPASFTQHTEWMVVYLLQFILAIPSAVQGAGMPDQKTASGYTAALNQALGQLGVIWGAVQRLMANVYRQAALCAAREDQDGKTIVVPDKRGNVTLEMGNLGKGRFLCHPDIDSGYPESTPQKRSTLAMLLDWAAKNPMVLEAVFQSPDNWDFVARTLGLTDITFPEAKVRRKQLAEIELMLQQAPIGPTPEELQMAEQQYSAGLVAAEAGMGAPPAPVDPMAMLQSSVQVDELDYHEWEFEQCREFLSDWPRVQQELNRGNEQGIENVRLHALEHQKFIQQKLAAQQAMAQPALPPGKSGQPVEKPEANPLAESENPPVQ